MYLSNESLIVILIVGIIAGWLAGQIVRGAGFGLIGDLLIGIIGVGTIALIVNATIGAVLLLLVLRLLRGGGGWRSNWGGGWGGRRW
jgi:uncharacterized membrane protein YeaQ/YmgE (transglycosylase-associated protein family)